MAFTHTTGEDFSGGGKFLDKEGWYHLMVSSASDTPKKPGGELINNCKFSIDCTAAAGSVEGCKDKTISLKFFEPNTSHKDKGAMACKKIDRALIAMNLLDYDSTNKTITGDVNDMVGQQFIVHLVPGIDPRFLEIAYTDIYHVDDPEVKGQPMDEAALSVIPSKYRRIGSKATTKPAEGQPANPSQQAAADPLDVDDLDL